MSNRTLVKVFASEHCIGFRTISRKRKSPQRFLITREQLTDLETTNRLIVQDICSFAVFRRNAKGETVSITFSWLSGGGNNGRLTGWEETVTLPYYALMTFAEASAQKSRPEEWRVLSLQTIITPHIVFADTEGLRKCLENRTVRGKLARALRDNFQGADRVEFYHDFESYSFMFQSYQAGRPSIVGGLILHDQNDLKKAYYSVHT